MTEGENQEVICRTPENEAVAWDLGKYLCVRVKGRYNDALAEAMRAQVFSREATLALDFSLLANMTSSFARDINLAVRNRRGGEHRLILVHPPDYLRSLLKLITSEIPSSVPDFDALPADPAQIETKVKEAKESLERIRQNLRSDPLWKFVDRDGLWVCPYCGTALEHARIVSRVNPRDSVVETIHAHVLLRCAHYDPSRPPTLSGPQLEKIVAKINKEKFAASREHAQALQTEVTRLEAKSKRADIMEKGLKVARERQKHLLPEGTPEIPHVDLSLVYRPAEEISGDFYDFIELDENRTAFVLGDVSGHGVEAGILMGMTKKVLQIRITEIPDLRKAVLKANSDVYREMGKKSFVTAFACVLDTKKKSLLCVRAGHNPPILLNPGRAPSDMRIEPGGTLLGMSAGPVIERSMEIMEVPLRKGDLILLYTDGLEETRNQKQEMLGRGRILEVMLREYDRPVGYILGALSYERERFAGEVAQQDDLTMIGIKIMK